MGGFRGVQSGCEHLVPFLQSLMVFPLIIVLLAFIKVLFYLGLKFRVNNVEVVILYRAHNNVEMNFYWRREIKLMHHFSDQTQTLEPGILFFCAHLFQEERKNIID